MDAFQDLLTQSSESPPAPEMLEMLGRKAAQMFSQQKMPLNQGIAQLIAEHPNLNNEHVRRIVEFANNSAFQEAFEKSPDKNVHFEVADPGVVIRDAKDGGSPAFDGKTLDGGKADYMSAPPRAQGDVGDAELSQLFAPQGGTGAEMAKVASANEEVDLPHTSHANPIDDVYDAHLQAQAARAEIASQNDQAEMGLKTAQDDFYRAFRNEVVDPAGAGLGGAVGALQKLAGVEHARELVPALLNRMMGEGVSPQYLERSLTKTAGAVLNPAHPMATSWTELVKAATARVLFGTALGDADRALAESHKFLRAHVR
jgi:hypothetical protein